ncbi:putative esterase and lipase [Podospora australis]|uniref:Esterase and lipase n=1 Tax=Podospora australis TaxID=1536484 RepID=A0AAN6WZ27_9PEZI|nr:putative esterase and lipase [Podospora australis]
MALINTLLCFLLWLAPLVLSSPLKPGINFQLPSSLPILTLPYSSYRASSYRPANDLYVFRNIRFAQPPVGNLRWAKPLPPLVNTTLQDGSYGPKCIQSAPHGVNFAGPGNNSPVGAAFNQFVGGIPLPLFSGGSEDCLFLDVYVPGKALQDPTKKLPVVVWIYGGAFLFGSKDTMTPDLPFYDGSGIVGQSNNNLIFVTINYRLGAYGFLAGSTMERDGLPNAGLHDQRMAFQWVKDYIHLLGGDPARVTAMGESAGASSILHHLVAEGGKLDPLFNKAIMQSPAFQPIWDRAGTVEKTFQDFAILAGCQGKGLSCLRAADPVMLVKANNALNLKQTPGTFAIGPTPDGKFIRQLPVLELASGKFWGIDSMILSHVADEASLFVSGAVQTDAQFSGLLTSVFPDYTLASGINAKVEEAYPPLNGINKSRYATQTSRVTDFLRDSCFTCHVRHLTEAYGDNKVWTLQYSVFPAQHATDLIPTFFSTAFTSGSFLDDLAMFFVPVLGVMVAGISTVMQSYFASYITTGDPNTNRKLLNIPPTIRWDHPVSKGEQMKAVLDIGSWGLKTVSDDKNEKTPCDFWRQFGAAVTALGGYSPPGELVPQTLVTVNENISRNYLGGNQDV